ncbi:MAG: hypothetical protein WCG25_01740 [bacterium]
MISIPLMIIGICLSVLGSIGPQIVSVGQNGESRTTPLFLVIGGIIAVFGLLWLIVSIFNTMNQSKTQLERFKETVRLHKKLTIALDFKSKIEKEFKEILTETFPSFEKDLVSKFSFENKESKEAFLAICPKLESGYSFEKYVNKLSDAMKEIQKVELEIDNQLAEIAVYNEDPWLWFRRPMPANIKELIDKFEGTTVN